MSLNVSPQWTNGASVCRWGHFSIFCLMRMRKFGGRCNEISSVLLKHEIWELKYKRASESVLLKMFRENKFPEFNADKEKLKIKTICSRKSANRINQKMLWKNKKHLDFFLGGGGTSMMITARGLYFTTLGVKSVNRHTNLYFSSKGNVHCIYVYVFACKIAYNSVCGAYITDNYFKIILCSMIRI
jgi:hypothetical protein